MKTPNEIKTALDSFTGTEQWFRYNPLFPHVLLTDGAKFVADECNAYWLMDLIASHLKAIPPGQYIVFAKLVVKDGRATFTIQDDDPATNVYATQEIEFTDFPLSEILLYIGLDAPNSVVICLPMEH